jgi:hypothetical protein
MAVICTCTHQDTTDLKCCHPDCYLEPLRNKNGNVFKCKRYDQEYDLYSMRVEYQNEFLKQVHELYDRLDGMSRLYPQGSWQRFQIGRLKADITHWTWMSMLKANATDVETKKEG